MLKAETSESEASDLSYNLAACRTAPGTIFNRAKVNTRYNKTDNAWKLTKRKDIFCKYLVIYSLNGLLL